MIDLVTGCPCCEYVLTRPQTHCPVCGCPLNAPASPEGRLLRNGAFRLLRRLDRGGMADVYLGEMLPGGEPCVVKEVRRPANRQTRAMFEALSAEEARLLGRLSREHAAIPRYYDSFMDNGAFYIVLEFVPGQNLELVLRAAGGLLPVGEVLDHTRQVVNALVVLHGLRPDPVVHGDIKPANLVRRPDGQVVLIDFGLARVNVPLPAYIPARPSAFGTPGYTPFEQWTAYPLAASDIFALGATMHHLITGRDPRTPFIDQAQVSLADLRAAATFPLLTSLVPGVSRRLDGLVQQMLSRRPEDRPTAVALQAQLTCLAR